ncbi:hypothetical protein IAU59_006745 [Kwoniella sp. CBS 9459]
MSTSRGPVPESAPAANAGATASVTATFMATELTTEGLLAGIGFGTAAELTMAMRYTTYPPGPTFIDPLDRLILDHRPSPSGSSLQRGDLVEIVGPSGSGKTSILTFLLMTTILSPTLPDLLSTPLGGRGMYATLIQPRSHRPLLPTLKRNMYAHIYSVNPAAPAHQVERVVRESLARLTVYRVKMRNRWKDVALSLRHLIDQSCPRPRARSRPSESHSERMHDEEGSRRRRPNEAKRSTGGGVDFLLIDGIGDPHYPHRWADEQRHAQRSSHAVGGSLGGGGRVVMPDEVGMKEVMEAIGRVRLELGAAVVLSNQGLRTTRDSQPFYIPHLPPPYPAPFAPSPASSTFHPSTSDTANLNPLVMRNDPTYWPLNIQITLTGKVRGLQYPGETTLVDVLDQKRKDEKARTGQDEIGAVGHVAAYEGIVRLNTGLLGSDTHAETASAGLSGSGTGGRVGAGRRFRFGISGEGLRVFSEEEEG